MRVCVWCVREREREREKERGAKRTGARSETIWGGGLWGGSGLGCTRGRVSGGGEVLSLSAVTYGP